LVAEAVRQALVGLGFDSSKVEMDGFAGFNIYTAVGTHGTPFNLVVGIGSCADRPDPASPIGQALRGFGDFSPSSAAYNRAFQVLTRSLKGKARVRALGRFDVALATNLAPVAVLWAWNDLTFFSDRVEPASLVFTPGYGVSLTALRLK
jgi:hypothetical protein